MGQLPRALTVTVAVVAIAGVALAIATRQMIVLWIFAALVIFLAGTTQLTRPVAAAVRTLEGPLRIDVWGVSIGDAYRLDKVQAFGAGLLIWATSGDKRVFIKVAQPRDVTRGENAIKVGRAKYVQVNRQTMDVVTGSPAIELSSRA